MVNEVEVVSRRDGHGVASPLGQPDVGLVEGLVHVHKPVDDGLPVGRGLGELRVHDGEHVRWDVLLCCVVWCGVK